MNGTGFLLSVKERGSLDKIFYECYCEQDRYRSENVEDNQYG
jgi:hypothetical protein